MPRSTPAGSRRARQPGTPKAAGTSRTLPVLPPRSPRASPDSTCWRPEVRGRRAGCRGWPGTGLLSHQQYHALARPSATARLAARLLLPTPPLPLATTMVRTWNATAHRMIGGWVVRGLEDAQRVAPRSAGAQAPAFNARTRRSRARRRRSRTDRPGTRSGAAGGSVAKRLSSPESRQTAPARQPAWRSRPHQPRGGPGGHPRYGLGEVAACASEALRQRASPERERRHWRRARRRMAPLSARRPASRLRKLTWHPAHGDPERGRGLGRRQAPEEQERQYQAAVCWRCRAVHATARRAGSTVV